MNKYWVLLLGIIINTTAFSQDSLHVVQDSILLNEKPSKWQNFKYDANAIGGGFLYTLSNPIRWDKDDWTVAGATAAGISLMYLADEETSDFFRKQEEHIPQEVRDFGWLFGRPEANYGLTAGVYLVGLFIDSEKVRETGVLLITSSAVGGLAQQTMKTVIGRGRPDLEKGHNQFRLFRGGHAYGSFPSGHTMLSTTTIYALSKQFSNPWVKAGLYTVGAVTPISRLWAGAHWLTDVTLSLVMSVAIVECIDNYLKKNKNYSKTKDEFGFDFKEKNKIKWNLSVGANQVGIIGTF